MTERELQKYAKLGKAVHDAIMRLAVTPHDAIVELDEYAYGTSDGLFCLILHEICDAFAEEVSQ